MHSTRQHSTTQQSDGKLLRNEAGLRAQSSTLCFTRQHSTTWWSDEKLVWREVGLGLGLRAQSSNPRAQSRTLYSTSIVRWSDQKFVWREVGLRAQSRTLENPCICTQPSLHCAKEISARVKVDNFENPGDIRSSYSSQSRIIVVVTVYGTVPPSPDLVGSWSPPVHLQRQLSIKSNNDKKTVDHSGHV